jgi:hypothetical protein
MTPPATTEPPKPVSSESGDTAEQTVKVVCYRCNSSFRVVVTWEHGRASFDCDECGAPLTFSRP